MGNSILGTVFASRRKRGLDAQLTRVRQLVGEEDFAGAAQLLARDRRNAFPEGIAVLLDAVHDLCVSAGDHMRLVGQPYFVT